MIEQGGIFGRIGIGGLASVTLLISLCGSVAAAQQAPVPGNPPNRPHL